MNTDLYLVIAFAFVAFVYASVGFGGGSSYLALLALAAVPFPEIRMTALLCNIVVVCGNSVVFARKNQIKWSKNIPLITASVPLAFLGARVPLHEKTFFLLLGFSLILAAALLWFQSDKTIDQAAEPGSAHPFRDAGIGGSIGLFSGLVGIGGGIFLSPLLHFLRWDGARKIAATASLFILVNSIAGITGQLLFKQVTLNWTLIAMLGTAVFIGGQLGLRFSLQKFNAATIRKVTAALVLFAGVEVLWKHLLH